jgi:cell division protein FtsL
MSLRPAQWSMFGVSSARRAMEPERSRAQRPNLTLVEGGAEPRIDRLRAQIRFFAPIAIVAAVLFGVVAFHVVLSQGQFQLEKMQSKADAQQTQYEKLRFQVAQLESPDRIKAEAMNRLGLVPADKVIPVTPGASDMPNGRVQQPGQATTPTTETDPGQWAQVKPHLSSASQ